MCECGRHATDAPSVRELARVVTLDLRTEIRCRTKAGDEYVTREAGRRFAHVRVRIPVRLALLLADGVDACRAFVRRWVAAWA
jgi:hypothetical protein